MKIFAIGDIHGCANELRDALAWIETRVEPGDRVITVGDYVDRGPYSRAVIDMLLESDARNPDRHVFIIGNHDVAMRDCILESWETPESAPMKAHMFYTWLVWGAAQTVASYTGKHLSTHIDFSENVPDTHVEFLRNRCVKCYGTERFVFVHGGILPDTPPEDTPEDTLTWLRDMDVPDTLGRMVICGHTPKREVYRGKNHVNIDTACVYGGHLTVLVLDDDTGDISVGCQIKRSVD